MKPAGKPYYTIRVWTHPTVPESRHLGTVKEVIRWIKANQATAHRIAVDTFRAYPLSGRKLILAILNNEDWCSDDKTIFDVRQPELGKMKSIDHELARVRARRDET